MGMLLFNAHISQSAEETSSSMMEKKRDLTGIQTAPGAKRFVLMYYGNPDPPDKDNKKQHVQLVTWAAP